MSRATPTGPPCPYCATPTAGEGHTAAGRRRYRCPACARYNTEGEARQAGRPRSADPSPGALRVRRHRERHN